MSKAKTSSELVDRYLQAVRFWMPKTRKQEGLLTELGDDLRSQIEDKEAGLGRELTVDEASEILKRCGSPMLVAGRFSPKTYLIGPTLFPIYTFVLKMVLFWILVPVFLFILGPINFANSGSFGAAVGSTVSQLWSALFISAGIVTLVFAILERTQAIADVNCKWDPATLPPLQKNEQKTSLVKAVCELAFGWIGLIWILLLPNHPFLIFGPAATFLKFGPIWHSFYIPIVLLGVFGLMRSGLTLAKPEWDWFPRVSEVAQTVLNLLLAYFLFRAVSQPPGNWNSLVVLTDAAQASAQHIKVVMIVNASILISLVGMWIGLCIAFPIQLWKLLVFLQKRRTQMQTPAFPQLL